jgi:hypothetical protein
VPDLRYQVVVPASEIGAGGTVTAISWHRSGFYPSGASYGEVQIFMGRGVSGSLQDLFDENYVPGSKTLVFEEPELSLEATPDGWFSLQLETPFSCSAGDNLIIDVLHGSSRLGLYTWHWNTGSERSLMAPDDSACRGYLAEDLPHMVLELEDTGLDTRTFGWIKRIS